MKTRACLFCGHRQEVPRQSIWIYDNVLQKCVKRAEGEFYSSEEVLRVHELSCRDREIEKMYGVQRPLDKWTNRRT